MHADIREKEPSLEKAQQVVSSELGLNEKGMAFMFLEFSSGKT